MASRIEFHNKERKGELIGYLEKAKRRSIDNVHWNTSWQYCHGEGRTTPGNECPNYVAFQKTSAGEYKTRLSVRVGRSHRHLTQDATKKTISTEMSWGDTQPLMKHVLGFYQKTWGVPVHNTLSEDEAEAEADAGTEHKEEAK